MVSNAAGNIFRPPLIPGDAPLTVGERIERLLNGIDSVGRLVLDHTLKEAGATYRPGSAVYFVALLFASLGVFEGTTHPDGSITVRVPEDLRDQAEAFVYFEKRRAERGRD